MNLAEFKALVSAQVEKLQGINPHTTADMDNFERQLGYPLPEALRWLLQTYGYSEGCGVSSLPEAVTQTLACRQSIGLPDHWLLLGDRGDAGAVLLDLQTGRICWCDAHQIAQVAAGEPVPTAEWFEDYPEWVVRSIVEDADLEDRHAEELEVEMDWHAINERRKAFQRLYMYDSEFIQQQYQVPSLGDILNSPGVVGVTRLIVLLSFAPEELQTFVYRPGTIEASAVIGSTPLWNSVPSAYQVEGEWELSEHDPFNPADALRKSTIVEVSSITCPTILRTWESLRAMAADAGSCMTSTCDGVGYQHFLAEGDFRLTSDWHNPDPIEHHSQVGLIKAYGELLRDAGL